MSTFDLPGALRRIRRTADLSQRELAGLLGVGKSSIGRVEIGTAGLDVRVLAQAAEIADLRLTLVDRYGDEVGAMSAATVRDGADRQFPAHLDTRYSDEGWWHDAHHYSRPRPSYTFDRDRGARNGRREHGGTPEDHLMPQPGDSPEERAAARRREHAQRRAADLERRFLAREIPPAQPFDCTCPDACDALDDRSGKPVHAPECSCDCDVA